MNDEIEREVVRRCREWLHPFAQDATDAEVVAHCEGSLFLASVRLAVAGRAFARECEAGLREGAAALFGRHRR